MNNCANHSNVIPIYFLMGKDRGVYEVKETANLNSTQVLSVVKELEEAAAEINSKVGFGIGGKKFKLAEII